MFPVSQCQCHMITKNFFSFFFFWGGGVIHLLSALSKNCMLQYCLGLNIIKILVSDLYGRDYGTEIEQVMSNLISGSNQKAYIDLSHPNISLSIALRALKCTGKYIGAVCKGSRKQVRFTPCPSWTRMG